MSFTDDPETTNFATQLSDVFIAAGWKVIMRQDLFDEVPWPGWHLFIPGPDSGSIKAIRHAFRASEIPFSNDFPSFRLYLYGPAFFFDFPHPTPLADSPVIWIGRHLVESPAAPSRQIGQWQEETLVNRLQFPKRGPICVIDLSESQEAFDLARKLRVILDKAGFADQKSPDVIYKTGQIPLAPENPQALLLYSPKEFPDYVHQFPECFSEIGLTLRIVVDPKNTLGLQPDQLAIVVGEK